MDSSLCRHFRTSARTVGDNTCCRTKLTELHFAPTLPRTPYSVHNVSIATGYKEWCSTTPPTQRAGGAALGKVVNAVPCSYHSLNGLLFDLQLNSRGCGSCETDLSRTEGFRPACTQVTSTMDLSRYWTKVGGRANCLGGRSERQGHGYPLNIIPSQRISQPAGRSCEQ
jgi:hypothetical protein